MNGSIDPVQSFKVLSFSGWFDTIQSKSDRMGGIWVGTEDLRPQPLKASHSQVSVVNLLALSAAKHYQLLTVAFPA